MANDLVLVPTLTRHSPRGAYAWAVEKLVLTVLEERFREACSCCAPSNDRASGRSLSPPCEGGVTGWSRRNQLRGRSLSPPCEGGVRGGGLGAINYGAGPFPPLAKGGSGGWFRRNQLRGRSLSPPCEGGVRGVVSAQSITGFSNRFLDRYRPASPPSCERRDKGRNRQGGLSTYV